MGLFLIKNILIKTSHLEVFLVFRLGHSLGEEEHRGKVPFISHSCQGYMQSAWFVSRIHAVSMVPHCDVDLDHLAEQRLSGLLCEASHPPLFHTALFGRKPLCIART